MKSLDPYDSQPDLSQAPAIPADTPEQVIPETQPDPVTRDDPALPVTPAKTELPEVKSHSGWKWFLFICIGLILITGLCVALYYFAEDDIRSVSVVRMEGTMVTGNYEDADVIGSEVVGNELREAADDPMVEAIVLRVNSPGGTPAAAQEIIGDLEYAKSKKPVVVSMGDMGTSAAYYVSSHADRIYANPDTFTAGVGVIWTFSDISQWMENEGYNVSVVKSGSKKDMGTDSRPMSSDEKDYAKKIVDDSFDTFISDVTTERSIIRSDIEDGRVIRGADAVKMNIVDELGNLNDAIDGAKRMAASRR